MCSTSSTTKRKQTKTQFAPVERDTLQCGKKCPKQGHSFQKMDTFLADKGKTGQLWEIKEAETNIPKGARERELLQLVAKISPQSLND